MKRTVMAVCGKGGVGKTTVSAMLALLLSREKELRTLAVDADPAGGLGMALSVSVKRSINEVRAETIRNIKEKQSDKKDLAMSLEFLLTESMTESGKLAFLSIGRPEEVGCYCSVNSLLRSALEVLAENFSVTIIDAEAGIEQVNRKVMSAVDFLLLVSDTSAKGLAVAETVARVAGQVSGQEKAGLFINRVQEESEVEKIKARTDLPVIGFAPEDDTVRQFDAEARSFLELPPCPALEAVGRALEHIRAETFF
ncbi:MAG: AAA family ATPase [bacterium]